MRTFTEIQTIFTEHYAVVLYQKEGHVGGRRKNRHESGILEFTHETVNANYVLFVEGAKAGNIQQ